MSTVTTKSIIDTIIREDGYYPSKDTPPHLRDPRVYQVVQYTNREGNRVWGITYEHEVKEMRYRYLVESAYIRNPVVIWKQDVNQTTRLP